MDSVSVWDEEAALQSCWLDCEAYPAEAYKYPSDEEDFLYLTGYSDAATRSAWYDNVLFFSCLAGCRNHYASQRWIIIIIPSLVLCIAFLVLVCCLICKNCPLARWCRGGRAKSASSVSPHTTPVPEHPFLVSTVGDQTMDYTGRLYNPRTYRRRQSLIDRKMESLPTPPSAPPAAEYNRLEPGQSYSGFIAEPGHGGNSFDAFKRKMSGYSTRQANSGGRVKVAQ